MLDDVAWQLDPALVQYLFGKIAAIPFSEQIVPTLDLVKELARWTLKVAATFCADITELFVRRATPQ